MLFFAQARAKAESKDKGKRTFKNCPGEKKIKVGARLGGGVHSHSRRTGVTEVGDGPQTEVARVWSERWIFAVMEKYPMMNDTDSAADSSSLVELKMRADFTNKWQTFRRWNTPSTPTQIDMTVQKKLRT